MNYKWTIVKLINSLTIEKWTFVSKFLIDEYNRKVYYDTKSDRMDWKQGFRYMVCYPNSEKFYVRLHRDDGPAIIWSDGSEIYYVKGICHRVDGPASINCSGKVFWWINDQCLPFENWCKELDKSEEEINYLKLKYNV